VKSGFKKIHSLFGLYSIIDHMTKQCTRWHLTPSKYILIYYYFNVLIQIINIKERQILSNKFGQNNILHDWYFILFIEIWLVQPFWYSIHARTWGLEQFLLDLRHIIAVCFYSDFSFYMVWYNNITYENEYTFFFRNRIISRFVFGFERNTPLGFSETCVDPHLDPLGILFLLLLVFIMLFLWLILVFILVFLGLVLI
jgi:hypothetical protein